ncbi:unnamed protein product [Didymodactylos carnosus]|nr:unnamed protein product [Didymodactylos carnosus]CAF4014963.1 unnamed protein product [Didymodactylos carnosus]
MADQIVAYLLRTALEEQTPKCFGRKDENVTDWIRSVTVEFELAKCPDHDKLDWVPTFLRGEALTWYIKNMDKINSWETFIEELEKKYSSVEEQHPSDSAAVTHAHSYSFHQQHYQVRYDPLTSISPTPMSTLLEYEEFEWPVQGETWTDYELRPQRKEFRVTPVAACHIFHTSTLSGTLSITSQVEQVFEENEEQGAELEVNDDRQRQLHNSVIRLMDEDRTLLLSKLYGVIKSLLVKRKVKPLLSSVPLFQFALSSSGLSSDHITSFHGNTTGSRGLLTTSIADIYQVLDACSRLFHPCLLEYDKMLKTFGDWNYLWPFLVP